MVFSPAGDEQYFDGSETVEVRTIRPDGVTSTTVEHVTNSPVNRQRNAFGGIEIIGDERQWSVASAELDSTGIHPDDLIIRSNGDSWRVISATHRTMDTRWLVLARKEI